MRTIKEGFLRKNIGLGKDILVKKWVEENIRNDEYLKIDILKDFTLRITLNDGAVIYNLKGKNWGDIPEYITISEIVYNTNDTLYFRNLNVKDWQKFLPDTMKISGKYKHIGLAFDKCNITPTDIKKMKFNCEWSNLIFRDCKAFSGNLSLDLSHFNVPYLISIDCDVKSLDIKLKSHGRFMHPGLSLSGNTKLSEITGDLDEISQLYLSDTKLGEELYDDIIKNTSRKENLQKLSTLLNKNQSSKNQIINKCTLIKSIFDNFPNLNSIRMNIPHNGIIGIEICDKKFRMESEYKLELNIKNK